MEIREVDLVEMVRIKRKARRGESLTAEESRYLIERLDGSEKRVRSLEKTVEEIHDVVEGFELKKSHLDTLYLIQAVSGTALVDAR